MSAEEHNNEIDSLVNFFMRLEVVFHPKPWFLIEEDTNIQSRDASTKSIAEDSDGY